MGIVKYTPVEHIPLELWATVQYRGPNRKREVIGTFTNYELAYLEFCKLATTSRRWSDDVYMFELVHLVEASEEAPFNSEFAYDD